MIRLTVGDFYQLMPDGKAVIEFFERHFPDSTVDVSDDYDYPNILIFPITELALTHALLAWGNENGGFVIHSYEIIDV